MEINKTLDGFKVDIVDIIIGLLERLIWRSTKH